MKNEGLKKAAKTHRLQKHRQKVVTCLAAAVVFCTTYALILPAVTLEKEVCEISEHTHSESCYTQASSTAITEPVCTAEGLNIHQHEAVCRDENGTLVCGYADFVVHQHDASCFDAEGNLWCPLPEIRTHAHDAGCYAAAEPVHTHTEECYTQERGGLICTEEESEGHTHSVEAGCFDESGTLICQVEEEPGHQHTDDCYSWEQVLSCGLTETEMDGDPKLVCGKEEILLHEHCADCFDKNDHLICGRQQVLRHIHDQSCFQSVEEPADTEVLTCRLEENEEHRHGPLCYGTWELTCELEEHTHTEECSPQSGEDDHALTEADPTVVVKAVVWLTGEDVVLSDSGQEMSLMFSVSPYAEASSGDIAKHLTSAQIEINGKPYDGETALNPGEQFAVTLQWQLDRGDLTGTLTYTYQLPEQIHVENVEKTVLYDENNNRKGVYSIKDGVLTVTYDHLADLSVTSLTLNATWNQDKIDNDTTVKWNDDLNTHVNFDNSQIAVTKGREDYITQEDGSLIAEYTVNVTASGNVEHITLTDTLDSQKFHFCQGYYEVNGTKYDYRYKIVGADGSEEYWYENFPAGTFGENGKQVFDTITFPPFNLVKGQTCTVEYAVKLDADDRFELDKDQLATGLTNSATASYLFNEEPIESSVTVTDTYRAEEKWIVKEREDAEQDTDVPWKVTVNPNRNYDMGGAVIGDSIQSDGVHYDMHKPFTVTSITDTGGSSTITPQWIQLPDDVVSAIRSAGGSAAEQLFQPENQYYLDAIEKGVGKKITKADLFNYVFVGASHNQFVWFTPETGTPTTYELSYHTEVSENASGALVNSASAGWKSWTSGVMSGSFLQEIDITKENGPVRQDGDDYFVDWTIILEVPADRHAISDVFLYDVLPYHSESRSCDWLMGLSSDSLDYNQVADENQIGYLNEISHSAFKISTTSTDSAVQEVVNNARTSLGHPVTGMDTPDYQLYEGDDTLGGQLSIENGQALFKDRRITPLRFGVWLGELPATTEGYIITVEYTTKVDPKLVEGLNGRAYGNNRVGIMQRLENTDILLGQAESSYFVDHVTAQNILDKSVVNFDPATNIITYRVDINPDASGEAYMGVDYVFQDVLNPPGASFIEDSFELSFRGTVSADAKFTWDDSKERCVLWRSDNGTVGLPDGLSAGMKELVSLQVVNPDNGSSQFTFTLSNIYSDFTLTEPEAFQGRFPPMVLTYQVQLPADAEQPAQATITNSVAAFVDPGDSEKKPLDGAQTEFDYTAALHKWLSDAPNEGNNYTAAFAITVDKTSDEWKSPGETFTVSDKMSKSLMLDVNSIQVYGIKEDNSEVLLGNQYTASYDDRASDFNLLSVTITDSEEYTKYRIVYNAHVQGEAEQTVAYDNVASVEGTDIRSEEVQKNVYIQKQDGNVVETHYEVKLLKFDAGDTAHKLEATFTLYALENGKWTPKLTNLTTDANGELVLNNTLYAGLNLGPNTWYMLEETDAPAGYLKGVTYFRIGPMGEDETKPAEIGSYTTIPPEGGTHQIPNYKASIRLHKTDEAKGESSYLTGAEFALYGNPDCSEKPLARSKEDRTGIYSFDLAGLTAKQNYYLKEVESPEGYRLSDTVYTLSFDQEGNVTLKNGDTIVQTDSIGAYLIANKTSHELPETGGFGTAPYTIGGSLLTGTGLLLLYNKKKRRKEDFASS